MRLDIACNKLASIRLVRRGNVEADRASPDFEALDRKGSFGLGQNNNRLPGLTLEQDAGKLGNVREIAKETVVPKSVDRHGQITGRNKLLLSL